MFPLSVPPLRSRPEDIPVLVEHFLGDQRAPGMALTEAHIRHLQTYDWPGNVRELKNVVERAVILSGAGPLSFEQASAHVGVFVSGPRHAAGGTNTCARVPDRGRI